MEITTQNVTENPQTPQYIADAWTFDPADPSIPVLATHKDSTHHESNRLDPVAWVLDKLKNHWHDTLLLAMCCIYAYALALPIYLGILYPIASLPAYFMGGVFVGVGFMAREIKLLTAWISIVGIMASGFIVAGVTL